MVFGVGMIVLEHTFDVVAAAGVEVAAFGGVQPLRAQRQHYRASDS